MFGGGKDVQSPGVSSGEIGKKLKKGDRDSDLSQVSRWERHQKDGVAETVAKAT